MLWREVGAETPLGPLCAHIWPRPHWGRQGKQSGLVRRPRGRAPVPTSRVSAGLGPCSRDQVLSILEGRGRIGNLETWSPGPSGGPATQSLSPREQGSASRREGCPPSRAHHKGQLENGCLWTAGLLPQKASPQASPGGRRTDQMASREFRPKILEDPLTLHAETCPLRTIGITVQSGEG